ncbi:MAG TPA: glycosyltransferase family 2 protein [Chloroflexota bacterium]
MQEHLRASVVVVTFNHRDVIRGCLEAVWPTLGQADEVIVVDNASSDGTPDEVAATYPWVRLIRSETNRGFGAACNQGATAARGEYLIFLNPDTQPCDHWLDALLEGLSAVPGAGLATARLLLARAPHLIDTFGNAVHISGITTSRGWGEAATAHTKLEEVSAISGACFAIAKPVFQKLGGFDERLFLYYEDTELSLRARMAGYRCVGVADARVMHDHRPGFSAAKLRYLERNRWWTLLKLYRWRTIIALAPVLMLGEIVAWAMAVRSGPGHVLAKLLAWRDLARWLPDLAAARASAARLRTVSDHEILRLHATHLHFGQVATGPFVRLAERAAEAGFRSGHLVAAALGARAR